MDESSHAFLFWIQTRKIGNLVPFVQSILSCKKVFEFFILKFKIGQKTLYDIQWKLIQN